MNEPLSVFLGWDPRETDAYDVAAHSFQRRSSQPLLIAPLALRHLGAVVDRPVERRNGALWCPVSGAPMATEFACSRFAVPLLQREGWALFADCDVLCLADVAELFALADPRYAVMCVKHAYGPSGRVKMDGQAQTSYSRKNWSSVMLINASHPSNQRLTRDLLETWPGRLLHAFRWLDDEEIGELPRAWNHLVGEYPPDSAAKLLHFTNGVPSMAGYERCDHAAEWWRERECLR